MYSGAGDRLRNHQLPAALDQQQRDRQLPHVPERQQHRCEYDVATILFGRRWPCQFERGVSHRDALVLATPGGYSGGNLAVGWDAMSNNTSGISNTAAGIWTLLWIKPLPSDKCTKRHT